MRPIGNQILGVIKANPGLSETNLLRVIGGSRGTFRHHLASLQKAGLVVRLRLGRETHYVPAQLEWDLAMKLAHLNHERGRLVFDQVKAKPGIRQAELVSRVGMTRKVLRGHLDVLLLGGLVEEIRAGRGRRYYVCNERFPQGQNGENPSPIGAILARVRPLQNRSRPLPRTHATLPTVSDLATATAPRGSGIFPKCKGDNLTMRFTFAVRASSSWVHILPSKPRVSEADTAYCGLIPEAPWARVWEQTTESPTMVGLCNLCLRAALGRLPSGKSAAPGAKQ